MNRLGEILSDPSGMFQNVFVFNFQETKFQIHFHPNSEEFGKLVENPLQKQCKLPYPKSILS
jgi:hypothetical protein